MTVTPDQLEQSVNRFVANEERLDKITNGGVGEDVNLSDGRKVPSISKLVATTSLQVLAFPTWAALSSIAPTTANVGAEVVGDTGTHNDPVTDAVVPNSGRFSFVPGEGNGWQRIGDAVGLSVDQATGAIVGGFASEIAYVHPNDAAERIGDGYFQNPGLGQSQRIDKTVAIQKIDTAFYSLYGAPFKGVVQVWKKTSIFDPTPQTNGTLVEEFVFAEAVYDEPFTLVLSKPALFRTGEFIAVYAIPDDGYKVGMRYWDHPRAGEPNPNNRTPLFFKGQYWSTGGVTSTFAYWQVPLKLYTNIPSLKTVEALAKGGGDEDNSVLSARVDVSIDDDGFLSDCHLFGSANIREFRRRRKILMAMKSGAIPPVAGMAMNLAHIADSYTADELNVTLEARDYKAEMGNGGPGWVGVGISPGANSLSNVDKSKFDNVQGNVDNDEVFPTFTAGTWASGGYSTNEFSPDTCAVQSNTANSQLNITYRGAATLTYVGLDYTVGDGSGIIEYRWNNEAGANNGGGWTTLALGGNGGAQSPLANIPAGAWVLNVRVKAGSGLCIINGFNLLTGQAGAVVHNLAVNGSSLTGGWTFGLDPNGASKRANHALSLARLGKLHTIVVSLATNDQNGYSPAQYQTGMNNLIDQQIRVGDRVGCDIVWGIMPETRTTSGFTAMSDFLAVAKKVRKQKNFALIDYQTAFGYSPNEYNREGTHRHLIGPDPTDNLHPTLEGDFAIYYTRENAMKYGGQ